MYSRDENKTPAYFRLIARRDECCSFISLASAAARFMALHGVHGNVTRALHGRGLEDGDFIRMLELIGRLDFIDEVRRNI